ncbi:hypothetical protein MLD38_029101 [Melastoma candidum]|uniref:Uncharacterized protein n=1 Tax=Melastoma candidum TaxID=119954 RepID=A0ACB9N760_9MYRT|nr:hypothetical protein MLD38_029101 [Melastoma candidum]
MARQGEDHGHSQPRCGQVRPSLHPKSAKRHKVGFLAFEVANLMSRLLQLWRSLSDSNVVRLRNEVVSLEGVRKIVSNDEGFLLSLACAEMVEDLRKAAGSVRRLGERCEDSSLLCFGRILEEFSDTGRDPNRWVQNGKEVEVSVKRMDRFVALTTNLLREMDELAILENSLRKAVSAKVDERNDSSSPMTSSLMTIKSINSTLTDREQRVSDLRQRIAWHKQEIKRLKERALWNRSFDSVVLLLARSIFTTLARIKVVFSLGHQYSCPSLPPRSPSSSAAIHPTESHETFVSTVKAEHLESKGFFKSNSRLLEPPATTLGANGLSLHYANLIIVMEKMIKSPQLVGRMQGGLVRNAAKQHQVKSQGKTKGGPVQSERRSIGARVEGRIGEDTGVALPSRAQHDQVAEREEFRAEHESAQWRWGHAGEDKGRVLAADGVFCEQGEDGGRDHGAVGRVELRVEVREGDDHQGLVRVQ